MKKMLAVVAAASLVAVAAPAFAANPFSDVPMNHWAYDAVEQMAAKGILEGYPNGTFKGNRAMTRYEIAQMVARMMANGVGGADADKLKALIVEFAPELEALGVKVDGFDGRLSKLEKGLSGWKISGQMRFDWNHTEPKDAAGNDLPHEHGTKFNRARLFLHRDMENGVSFDMRWHGGRIDRFWLTAKDFLGWQGFTFKAGQFALNWMGDDGLYYADGAAGVGGSAHEDDAWAMDHGYRGFAIAKTFGFGEFAAFYASDIKNDGIDVFSSNQTKRGEYYGARLKFNLGEKFWLSANGLVQKPGTGWKYDWDPDDKALLPGPVPGDASVWTRTYEEGKADYKYYWIGAGFKFSGLQLKGAYMWMKNDVDSNKEGNAWKIILDVPQSMLKFTSLWVEFQKLEENWKPANTHGVNYAVFSPKHVGEADAKVLFLAARQQWNKKFSTYERYTQYKYDKDLGKDKEWAVGLGYAYTSNLYFDLSYNKLDYSDDTENKVVRFRTILNF
jgi:hypothetical protein